MTVIRLGLESVLLDSKFLDTVSSDSVRKGMFKLGSGNSGDRKTFTGPGLAEYETLAQSAF